MDFTGERFVPGQGGELAIEHWHRYALCRNAVAGKSVLDIACGEGYGSALLSQHAKRVVGVDLSQEAVDHAGAAYSDRDNLSFVTGSADRIPFPDASFDIVVSFETIEHLEPQEAMLSEIRRVLAPGGALILSSPDRKNYSDARNYNNEFHVRELYFEQLDDLLGRYFPAIVYYGQRNAIVSMVTPKSASRQVLPTSYAALLGNPEGVSDSAEAADEAMYWIATCAIEAADLPDLACSVLTESGIDLYKEHDEKIQWAIRSRTEIAQAGQLLKTRDAELHERTEWARLLERDVASARLDVARLEEELGERARWASSLEADIDLARAALVQCQGEFEERTQWAVRLEAELKDAREALAQRQSEFNERTQWALQLDEELAHARLRLSEASEELGRRDLTIQEHARQVEKLDEEVQRSRVRLKGMQELEARLTSSRDLQVQTAHELKRSRVESKSLEQASQRHIGNLDAMLGKALHEQGLAVEAMQRQEQAFIELRQEFLEWRQRKAEEEASRRERVAMEAANLRERTASALDRLEGARSKAQADIHALLRQLESIQTSTSWKATAWLRRLMHSVRGRGELAGETPLLLTVDSSLFEATALELQGLLPAIDAVARDQPALADQADTQMPEPEPQLLPASQEPTPMSEPAPESEPEPEPDPVAGLAFAEFSHPRVSVIVPAYGNLPMTARCLRSLMTHAPDFPFEVIVAEDASPDAAIKRLAQVPGLRYVEFEQNAGFLENCNRAARLARGEYLHFLNNDAEILPGALEALCDVFTRFPRCGLAGSKLLNPDMSLQEAGGIIWRDGSGWNVGRGADAGDSAFNYVREVDYCSGASIMVPSSLFQQLGGFDPIFAPAYYEDTDLAFRMRDAQWQVLYVPGSRVIHHEGGSHGTDVNAGVKAFQVRNQAIFLERWRDTLQREHFDNGQDVFLASGRSRHRPHVLIVDHYVPQPDRDAGSRVMMDFIDAFLDMGYVVKFWPHNMFRDPVYSPQLETMGVEVIHGGGHRERFARYLEQHGQHFETVLLSRPDVALDCIDEVRRNTRAKVLYFGHDLHSARLRREYQVTQDRRLIERAEVAEAQERHVWSQVDVSLYPSDEEVLEVLALAPNQNVQSIPLVAFREFAAPVECHPEGRAGILFVAGFAHRPNVDAAQWLVHEVLPMLRREHPAMCVSLVGSNPTQEVLELAGQNVEVTGYVSQRELEARYRQARVVVAPLRFGAGVKLKVLESLRHGVPLVTTSVGAQGLAGLQDVAAVFDDPGQFAASVDALLRDDLLWQRRSVGGVDYVQRNFSQDSVASALRRALDAAPGPTAVADRTPGAASGGGGNS